MNDKEYGRLFKTLLDIESKEEDNNKLVLFNRISEIEEFYQNEEFLETYKDKINWGIVLINYKHMPIKFIERFKDYLFSYKSSFDVSHGNLRPIYRTFLHDNVSEDFLEDLINSSTSHWQYLEALVSTNRSQYSLDVNRRVLSEAFLERNLEKIIENIGKTSTIDVRDFIAVNCKSFNIKTIYNLIRLSPESIKTLLIYKNDLPISFLEYFLKNFSELSDEYKWGLISAYQKMSEEFIFNNITNKSYTTIGNFILNKHVERTEKILKLEEEFILKNIDDNDLRNAVVDYLKAIERTEKVMTAIKMYEI
ncbi:hypothetical protein Bp8pS_104 [Bacillus phage vB_BpuM-BpSp]|nr:hypothetical protein Bp8pS_104 [Bacillus phage vB_BpuM-BpSp]